MENKLSKTENVGLPEALIVEIQLRLPVKSLMRFCCVSKTWLSTISDPKFRKAHFKLASQKQTPPSPRLLITTTKSQIESLELETPSFGVRNLTSPIEKPLHTPVPIPLCSCQGLVLMRHPGLYIWNPTTHYVHSLTFPSRDDDIIVNCGFGHVSASDDYKIAIRSYFRREYRRTPDGWVYSRGASAVEIFSMRANSWKRKEFPMFQFGTPCCSGIILNEALHWVEMYDYVVDDDDDDDDDDDHDRVIKYVVIAFDLGKEELLEIALPMVEEYNISLEPKTIDVCVSSGGCLGLTCLCDSGFIQCWVMTEYNVPNSWTKLFKLYVGIPHRFRELVFFSESFVTVKQRREDGLYLVRFDRQEEKPDAEIFVYAGHYKIEWGFNMIKYDENLLQLDDYLRT